MNIRTLSTLALVAVAAVACRREPEPEPVPMPVVPMVNQDSIDAANRARVEAEARARAAMEAARAAFATAIYFDYDKSELKPEARTMLDAKLPLLRANANVRIRIAGHTDDRGSDEYNIALSQRRAASAKRYLVDQGIAADRIDVAGFGEDRAAAMGTGEENWARNRRDEFEIIVGGESLRLP